MPEPHYITELPVTTRACYTNDKLITLTYNVIISNIPRIVLFNIKNISFDLNNNSMSRENNVAFVYLNSLYFVQSKVKSDNVSFYSKWTNAAFQFATRGLCIEEK